MDDTAKQALRDALAPHLETLAKLCEAHATTLDIAWQRTAPGMPSHVEVTVFLPRTARTKRRPFGP